MYVQKSEFTCNFFLRTSKPTKSGEMPIYMKIGVGSKMKQKSTGLTVPLKFWLPPTQNVDQKHPDARDINNRLFKLQEKYRIAALNVREKKRNYTLEHITNEFDGKKEIEGVLEFYRLRLTKIEALIGVKYKRGTFVNYRTALKHLTRFIEKELGKTDILIGEVGIGFLEDFLNFLQIDCKCQINSANKNMRVFRAVLYEAKKRDLIGKSPFENFSLKYDQTERPILNEQELKHLLNASFENQRIDNTRKIFLFACLTGLAYADIKDLKGKHLVKLGDQLFIHKPRVKSSVNSSIPLSRSAIEIIENYQTKSTPLSTSFPPPEEPLIKTPSNQKLNAYLKEIADLCGIDKNLTFHCARHTFATTVTLSNGVPIESVSKMLGHTSIKTTQIYAKVLESKLVKDMKGVFGKY